LTFEYRISDGLNEAVGTVYISVFLPGVPGGQLWGARPVTEYLKNRWVPEGETIYIRRNGDDDNGDEVPDNTQSPVVGENDLIQGHIGLSALLSEINTAGYSVVLRRSSDAIQVWESSTKTGPMFTVGNEFLLANPPVPDSDEYTFFTEWRAMDPEVESATLELIFRKAGDPDIVASTITYEPFNSVVIAYVGEFQTPGDMKIGLMQIADELYASGFDVHPFDEDDIMYDRDFVGEEVLFSFDLLSFFTDPPKHSLTEVKNAVLKRGVSNVAIIGYSHGAGATYVLAEELSKDDDLTGKFTLEFTAYIDGVKKQSLNALGLKPIGTEAHYNVYQHAFGAAFGFKLIQGTSVPGSLFDDNTDTEGNFFYPLGLTHSNKLRFHAEVGWFKSGIAEEPAIQEHLVLSLMGNISSR
jgi:hypothetical protein